MNRSTIAKAILPALLLQILPPAGAAAGPAADKDSSRPRSGPIQRTTDKEGTRPRSGPLHRTSDQGSGERPVRRPIPRVEEPGGPGERRDRTERFDYEAPNGFRIEVLAWPAESGGFTAAATLSSRSGERMTFELSPDAGFGPVVLIDGEVVVSYDTARDGRLRKLTVHDGERAVSSFPARAGRAGDHDAYLHLAESVAARHSPRFLLEMRTALQSLERDAVAPADLRQFIECALGVTGYVASVWGIIAGCVVGGVPTLGASCIFAILAHELAVASAILSCFP